MRRLALVAMALLVMASPQAGRAHLFHLDALLVVISSVEKDPDAPDERLFVGLSIINGTANAATLRGLRLEGHGELAIERYRDLIILQSWQPVTFVRIDAWEELSLGPPRFRISVPARAWQAGHQTILADFGPLGDVEAFNAVFELLLNDAIGQ